MLPIKTDYRMRRRPWVNYALILINVGVFLAGFHFEGHQRDSYRLLLYPQAPELYQFFTSIFLHAGWGHLLGNMVFLWVFGNGINDRLGHLGYAAFYIAGGIVASLGYLALSGQAPVLGASGAISAVTGAYLVLLPRTHVMVLLVLPLIIPFEISSLYFVLFYFIENLIMTLGMLGAGSASTGGGVAYAAHLAGAVFGIVMTAGLLAARLLPRDAYDLLSLIRHGRQRGRYRSMVAGGYNPFSPPVSDAIRRPADVTGARTESGQGPAAQELELRRQISQACLSGQIEQAAAGYLKLVQIADDAVLPQQQQLDVANWLMSTNAYPAAADAYERFARHHASYGDMGDIYLLLGLLYGRYLQQYDRAEDSLNRAAALLRDPGKTEMARTELDALRRMKRR
ncbi:MAG: rhomboid family intramembrane serine protease [Planctomycetaceae bacterium]|nr:rhomboid family intramembrane serine protease [Planctomycetaceae bacterium]